MKIDIKTINKTKKIEFNGSENWLKDFYEAYPNNNNEMLSGDITLAPDEYEHCNVYGSIDFKIHTPCTRCTKPVVDSISREFEMLFRPSKYDTNSQEVDLSSQELDANYMNENDEINVAQVLLDLVNEESSDVIRCDQCSNKTVEGPLYKSPNDEKLNPFAKLKDLKLPN